MTQVAPAGNELGQLFVWTKSPVAVMLEIGFTAPLVFVRISGEGRPELPTFCVGSAQDPAESVSVLGGAAVTVTWICVLSDTRW